MAKIPHLKNTPIQTAFRYTFILSILYTIYKFSDIAAPKGSAFISYIIPSIMTNVVLVVFPILFIFFYFKDGTAIDEMKGTFINKDNTQISELNNQEMLREYHGMLKEGVITQEEYDSIKKKYLKDIK